MSSQSLKPADSRLFASYKAASGVFDELNVGPAKTRPHWKTLSESLERLGSQELAARAENCRRARSHMATLDSGIRLSRTNEKGEREILDDKQVADEMNRTRQIISSDCRAS